jgi:hypothetical protein
MSMKTLLVFVAVSVVIVAPAFAQLRSKAVAKGCPLEREDPDVLTSPLHRLRR